MRLVVTGDAHDLLLLFEGEVVPIFPKQFHGSLCLEFDECEVQFFLLSCSVLFLKNLVKIVIKDKYYAKSVNELFKLQFKLREGRKRSRSYLTMAKFVFRLKN